MKLYVAIVMLTGCALLTWARIPAFSSDRELWWAALPSEAPRVYINVGAALLQDGAWESAGAFTLEAIQKVKRPASEYERAAVVAIVRQNIQYLDTWYPVCSRPAYQPYCW